MAVIKSGNSTSQLQVDTASSAARVTLYDGSGNALGNPIPVVLSGTSTVAQGAAGATAWLVNGSGSTQPVSGTVTSNQGTAGAAAWLVNSSNYTQPIAGSVTANIGTSGSLALDASLQSVFGAAATPGTAATKSILHGGLYSATPPTATNGQQVAMLVDAAGRLAVNVNTLPALGSGTNTIGAVNQGTAGVSAWLVSGTVTANLAAGTNAIGSVNQAGTWNIGSITGTVSLPTNAAIETGGNLAGINTKLTTSASGLKIDGSSVIQPVSGSLAVSTLPALPAGSNQVGSVIITSSTNLVGAGVFGGNNGLRVSQEASQLFLDSFDTGLDTAVKWNTPVASGGGVAATNSAGATAIGSGTTANGYSYLQSQPSFGLVSPSFLQVNFSQNVEFPVLTNAYRFWGVASIPAAPTPATPLTDAVGFEISTAGKLYAVQWSAGIRTVIADLSSSGNNKQPVDANVHAYGTYIRGERCYWTIDGFDSVVATVLTGAAGPVVNTLPLAMISIAGSTAPTSSALVTCNGVWMGDTSKRGTLLTDGTYPWRRATIKPASVAAAATDPALVVAMSPNAGMATSALQSSQATILNTIAANTGASAVDYQTTGTIAAVNGSVSVYSQGVYTVSVSLAGAWSATLVAQGQLADLTWVTIPIYAVTQTLPYIPTFSTTTAGTYLIIAGAYLNVRIIATSYTSGTINVAIDGSLSQQAIYCSQMGSWLFSGTGTAGNPAAGVLSSQVPDNTTSATLAAANSNVILTHPGAQTVGFSIPATATLVATLQPQVSYDGGTTWVNTLLWVSGTLCATLVTASGTANAGYIIGEGGAGQTRIIVLSYTSGTATVTLRASQVANAAPSMNPVDGAKATYSAATVGLVAVATTPTDIFTITGSATRTIRVTKIEISGTQTTAAQRDVLLIRRSTANTAGTFTAVPGINHDPSNVAQTATVLAYTANPTTLGTTVGTIRTRKAMVNVSTATSAVDNILWDFGNRPGQAIVLRGLGQVLAINLNSVASAGNLWNIYCEFTEE